MTMATTDPQQMNGFAAKPEKKYGIWHGALSGRFYASFAKRVGDPEKDLWEQTGVRHDVTESVEAYIAMAVMCTSDLPRLAELRANLREKARRSPLCDAARFGASLGGALRHAWTAWCADRPHFELALIAPSVGPVL